MGSVAIFRDEERAILEGLPYQHGKVLHPPRGSCFLEVPELGAQLQQDVLEWLRARKDAVTLIHAI